MPSRKTEVNDGDLAVLDAIDTIRSEKLACSIQLVADDTGLSKTAVKARLDILRRMGYADWTEAYGSVHLTVAGLTLVRQHRRSGGSPSPAAS